MTTLVAERLPRSGILRAFDLDTGGGRLPAMEGLRAYAVLLTFCVHFFGAFMLELRKTSPDRLAPLDASRTTDAILSWLQMSPYGVYLFFILSGFLICRMIGAARDFSYARFLARRIHRIYPAFLLALALGVLVFAFYAGWAPFTWTGVAANVLLLNGIRELGVVPYLHQTWSLFNEMVFYLVFPVLLLARPLGVWRSPWAMAVAGIVVVYVPFVLGWGQAMYLLFFAGATAARFDDESLSAFARRVPQAAVAAAYLAVTTVIGLKLVGDHAAIWLYAIGGTLFAVSVCYGSGALTRFFAWRPMRRLGNVSYSLFLTHTIPIFFVVYVLGPRFLTGNGLGPALAAALLAWLGAMILAGILFLIAERPYFAVRTKVQG